MKTQISRDSHNASKRYSGVYHQQGRMLTDADWNELADIVKDRLADVLSDVIGSGAPRGRGLIQVTGGATPTVELHWGYVYVDGVVAQVRPDESVGAGSSAFQYTHQADFPSAAPLPGTGNYRLYLDVWERPVLYFENAALRDAGLHGADTCTRTQTMAQVKRCPTSVDPENPSHNPARGNAELSLQIRAGMTGHDPCDPCADEVQLQERTGNYLFRVEIHDVVMGAGGTPNRVTLKWSSENGAEQYEVGNEPLGFKSDQWIYEFVSGGDDDFACDKHLGVHHADSGWAPRRGTLSEGYPASPPAGLTLVRRWDGYCELQRATDNSWSLAEVSAVRQGMDRGVRLSPDAGGDAPGRFNAGTTIEIKLDAIELTLNLLDKQLVAGDYWMVAVREAVHGPGSPLLQNAEPMGIAHHYLTLGDASGTGITWAQGVWNAERLRQFDFPPLSDLNANDVGYTMPACEANATSLRQLLEQALGEAWPNPGDNNPSVRDILDTLLCHFDARHLPLEKDSTLCAELRDDSSVHSVQDAINALCARQRDGCSTYTVFPVADWYGVFAQIGNGEDAYICFQAGDYTLEQPLNIDHKGHIKISGCGAATRIVAAQSEAVFMFSDCDSVTVRDIYVEAGVTGNAQEREHLNGALTLHRCRRVELEGVIAKCAAGTRRAASCITVANDRLVAAGPVPPSVRIRACEARMGYYQVGILLINAHRAQIEDNQVRVARKPKGYKLARLAQEKAWRVNMRHNLVKDAFIGRRAAAVTGVPETRPSGTEEIVAPAEEAGAAGEAARPPTRDVVLTHGEYEIRFNSDITQSDWDALMSRYPARDIRNNRDLMRHAVRMADRALLEPTVREASPGLQRWYDRLAQDAPSIAAQGIVCGGRVAGEVRILNNTVTGALETIHVGVSHRPPVEQSYVADRAGTVIIRGNNLRVYLPALFKRGRHGIFVGNCNHLLIEDNRVNVNSFQASRSPTVEGVRVYGLLGRMMIVRQNFLENCTTGVFVKPLRLGDRTTRDQWLVADNMMPHASTPVDAPNSVRKRDNYA